MVYSVNYFIITIFSPHLMGALVYILLMLNVLHWFCAVCTGSTEQQKQGSLVYFFMRTAAKFVLNDSQ